MLSTRGSCTVVGGIRTSSTREKNHCLESPQYFSLQTGPTPFRCGDNFQLCSLQNNYISCRPRKPSLLRLFLSTTTWKQRRTCKQFESGDFDQTLQVVSSTKMHANFLLRHLIALDTFEKCTSDVSFQNDVNPVNSSVAVMHRDSEK